MITYNGQNYYTYEEMSEDVATKSKPDWVTWDTRKLTDLLNVKGVPYIKTPFGWVQISKAEYMRHKRKGVELYG